MLPLVLGACRRTAAVQVAAPTATVTPYSTPLPAVATAIPPGADDNPVQMVIYSESASRAATNAATALEEALSESLGITVEVVLVDSYASALGALCDSVGGVVSTAWVDGITYAAAQARGCGTPSLMVERGTGRSAQTGEVVHIIASRDEELSLIALAESTFCRVGVDDLTTWLVPSLVLQAGGVRPLYDLAEINDYADEADLLEAVQSGDCHAAGISASALDEFSDGDTEDTVETLTETPPIPYGILMYPPETPLGLRLAMDDALIELADDAEQARALGDLLGQDALVRVEDSDLAPLRAFVESSGLDLAQVGE